MFSDAGTWILISFFVFICIFGRKIWSAVSAKLDEYIDQVKNQLQETENIKKDADKLLLSAKNRKSEVERKVSAIKDEAQEKISVLEQNNKKTIENLEIRLSAILEQRIKTEMAKQKQKLLNLCVQLLIEEITKRAKKNSFSEEELLSDEEVLEIKRRIRDEK